MITAIIVAAGTGTRMGIPSVPKQFLPVEGMPILAHTLRIFDDSALIDHIVLVCRAQDRERCEHVIDEYGVKSIYAIVNGGEERQDSVFYGLQQAHPDTEIVIIHDAVRMFVTEEILAESIRTARQYGASVTAVPVKDTIKQIGRHNPDSSTSHQQTHLEKENEFFVVKTLDRKTLWQIQTPQTFRYALILSIHQQARDAGVVGTDDASLAEYFGHPVNVVQGAYRNIKITTPDDLLIAQAFLQDTSRTRKYKP